MGFHELLESFERKKNLVKLQTFEKHEQKYYVIP